MTRSPLAAPLAAAVFLLALGCASAQQGGDASGERLYRSRCAACHRLHPPERRTRGEWATVVGRMARRAHLSDGDRARLLEYLQTHSAGGS